MLRVLANDVAPCVSLPTVPFLLSQDGAPHSPIFLLAFSGTLPSRFLLSSPALSNIPHLLGQCLLLRVHAFSKAHKPLSFFPMRHHFAKKRLPLKLLCENANLSSSSLVHPILFSNLSVLFCSQLLHCAPFQCNGSHSCSCSSPTTAVLIPQSPSHVSASPVSQTDFSLTFSNKVEQQSNVPLAWL
ncbi:hypothetical protein TRVL_07574 [Trypanosoma vivax]|nr:hypothetical protein TRVL_07574 [Trypanosoma vivax]